MNDPFGRHCLRVVQSPVNSHLHSAAKQFDCPCFHRVDVDVQLLEDSQRFLILPILATLYYL